MCVSSAEARPLKAIGVKVGPAKLTGSSLGVRVKVRQRTRVKLTAVRRKQRAKVAKATLAKGRHRFKAQLPAGLLRPGLQLRTVAKNLVTGRKATGRLRIRVPVAGRAPTDITLAPAAVAENLPPGQVVGTLTAADPDAGDTHAFTVLSGPFTVVGTSLRTTVALDTEASPSQTARVRATDARGLVYEKDLTVTVTNVNEPPTSLALDPRTVAAGQPAGATAGTLTASDPDQFDTRTFALAAGAGDTDNALFVVDGILLRTTGPLPATPATRSVRLKVTDAGGLSFEQQFTITVTPGGGGGGNRAPVLTATSGPVAYTENAPAVAVDDALGVVDPDSVTLTGAEARISTGSEPGDVLVFSDQAGITGTYDGATGVLTLAGSATVAEYETALRSIRYRSTSDAPAAAKAVTFSASDGVAVSDGATRAIAVTAVNDAPVVTTSAGTAAFATNGPPVPVDPALTVSDADSTQLQGATVTIAGGPAAQDTLSFTDQGAITGSFDSATGELSLTGVAALAQYQAALRSIEFSHGGAVAGLRRIDVRITDTAGAGSDIASRDVLVTVSDVAPVVTTSAGGATVDEDAAGGVVDAGVTVSDGDDANLQSARVRVVSGLQSGDELTFVDTPQITGTYTAASGVLALAGTATVAEYQAALRSITFSADRPGPDRVIGFRVTDDALDSNEASRPVAVIAVNDAPRVQTSAPATTVTFGGPAVPVDSSLTVSDEDDADLESARVRVSAGFQTGDTLAFANTAQITGSYAAGTGVLTLTGPATVAQYQAALRSVTFSATQGGAARTVAFRVNDGSVDSDEATKTVNVVAPNAAPTVTTTLGNASYTENGPGVIIDAGVVAADPDGGNLAGATVSITAGRVAGDALTFVNTAQITGTYDPLTGVLSLAGSATIAQYQAALRSITFQSTSDNPGPSRTVSFQVTDGAASSNTATKSITVTVVDDPPVAVANAATVNEDDPAAAIAVLANDPDPDGGPKVIASATDPANGTVVLTGGGPGAHTGLTYQPDPNYCNNPPGTTPDTFTYTLNGGSSATVSVSVTCVNDAPVADDEAFNANDSAIGNTAMVVNDPSDGAPAVARPRTAVTGDILAGDTDIDGPGPLTVTPGTFPTNDGGAVSLEADGDFVFDPAPSTSCTDTSDFFDYTVEDSGTPERTDTGRVTIAIAGCVWYVHNNASGNAGTSAAPFDTLAQAETASGVDHTVFVFDGDNTTTGMTTGYAMNAGERLIGEHEGLVVDPDRGGPLTQDTLLAPNAGARPTLAATGEDVVDLDDGNELRGFVLDPSGAGGGIAGSAGDVGGGTIDDVNVTDTGTAGTQPGVELDGTTGTFAFSNLNVTTAGAAGVRLNNAGTVDLDAPSLAATGAPVLDAAGTNMATSAIGALTSTGSGTGGVRLSATTGATSLGDGAGTDLALATTSGATPALQLANAGTVTIDAAGGDDVSATGGPAVDILNTAGTFAFDSVSSSASAGDGINLDGLGASAFSAQSGSVAAAAVVGFDLNGGSGSVTYPGAVGTTTGRAVDVTNRTGGAVALAGAISDSGTSTGINVSGNTGGTVTFSGAGSDLSTGTAPAVSASSPGTLAFTGGNLLLASTTGTTFQSTGAGTLTVAGTGNRLRSTAGTALNVSGTTIGAGDLNFTEIDADNPSASGIALANTGAAGGLTVSGSGGGCTSAATCTGGAIVNADAAGIALTNVGGGVALTRTFVGGGLDDGIRGSEVAGLTLDNVVVASNGNAVNENGLDFTGLTGTVTLTTPTITGNAENNVSIVNDGGTLNATVTGGRIAANSQTLGNDGLLAVGTGTGTMNLTVQNTQFEDNRGDHVQLTTDASTSVVQNLTLNGTTMITTAAADPAVLGGGVTVNPGGNAVTDVAITNSSIQQAFDSAITIDTPGSAADPQPVQVDVTITGNTIGTAGVADSGSESGNGITVNSNGGGDIDALVSGNAIQQYANFAGIDAVLNDGNGTLDLTARANTIANPGMFASNGILVRSGMTGSGETSTACLDIGHPSDPALRNTLTGAAGGAANDIRVRHLASTTVRLPGYGGSAYDSAAVTSYLLGRQTPGADGSATSSGAGGGYQNVTGCTLP